MPAHADSDARAGAATTALDAASLTPFHVAIRRGNTRVVRWFLEQPRGTALGGCHPSKAAPDGRTPLQLALASGVPELVQLLLKDATVHDAARCWAQDAGKRPEIRDVLLTKVSAAPLSSCGHSTTLTVGRPRL